MIGSLRINFYNKSLNMSLFVYVDEEKVCQSIGNGGIEIIKLVFICTFLDEEKVCQSIGDGRI